MEFRVLGPLEVVDGDRAVALGGARQRAVLALLVLHAGRTLTADRLIDELWAGEPPASAVTTLRGYLSHLRRALEPHRRAGTAPSVLVSDGAGYRLVVEPGRVDAQRCDELVARARQALGAGRAAIALGLVDDALALWRGPALADFAYEPFAQADIARLEQLRAVAEDLRVDARLALGHHAELIGELEARVAATPLRERTWAQLMTAQYRCGRQADALRAYQRARGVLADELGVDPGPELVALEGAVLAHDASLDTPLAAAPPTGNLPHPLTRFVGRERERAEVLELVRRNRLVTLVGPGGAGKTRLALEAAAAARSGWGDGVWLVELAAVADPALVTTAVATALGVPEQPGAPLVATLTGTLADRRLLVVLDNCEQVVEACARLARELLSACPGLHVLATSRQPMAVAGEVSWTVPALATDPPEGREEEWRSSDAVTLLADRAAASRPGFFLTDADRDTALRTCRRLDGLPLAIELAAARLRTLSLQEVADRLDDRFALLTTGDPTTAPRHQTLRAAVEWSHELLDVSEQAVFARLAVFAGPFSLAAAEAVAAGAGVEPGEVLDVLGRLVDKSLVARRADVDGAARFHLLDTLRAYGAERLRASGQESEARSRHVAWHLALAEAEGPRLRGPSQAMALERLDASADDLRAALAGAAAAHGETAVRLATALWWYWVRRSRLSEGREWLARALAAAGPDAAAGLRGTALAAAAYLAWVQDDLDCAGRLAAEAQAVVRSSGDDGAQALASAVAARIALSAGDPAGASAGDGEALGVYRRSGDTWGEAWVLRHLAGVALARGDLDEAAALADGSRALFATLDDGWGVAGSVDLLAGVALDQGDLERARELGEASVRAYRRLGDRAGLTVALYHLAVVLRQSGDAARASTLAAESAAIDRRLGGRVSLVAATALVDELADVPVESGQLP